MDEDRPVEEWQEELDFMAGEDASVFISEELDKFIKNIKANLGFSISYLDLLKVLKNKIEIKIYSYNQIQDEIENKGYW